MKQIILATNNVNKLREVHEILEPIGFKIISQADAGVDIEVDETGATFEENAYLKAKAVFDITGLPCIADDSGLEVDFLNGEPGVYSARYAPKGQRCNTIISKLDGIPDEKRTARFVSCMCFIDANGKSYTVRGTVEGKIGYEKKGANGFGYDPIFMYGNKSFSELLPDEKNAVSHRSKALKKLLELLKLTLN